MGDYTVTLTVEEEIVIGSYFELVQDGILWVARRAVLVRAKELIRNSSSVYDPNKMTIAQIRMEINNIADEIPTHAERNEIP